jgi:hypothetical protein
MHIEVRAGPARSGTPEHFCAFHRRAMEHQFVSLPQPRLGLRARAGGHRGASLGASIVRAHIDKLSLVYQSEEDNRHTGFSWLPRERSTRLDVLELCGLGETIETSELTRQRFAA